MDNIMWVRWYKLYADGMLPTKDDHYEYQWYNLPDTSNMVELGVIIEQDIEASINLYEEGEHYRCFRWEYINKPPQSYIDEQIRWHERSIKYSTSMLDYFKGIKDNNGL